LWTADEVRRVRVTSVRFEHLRDPVGIGIERPRISWRIEDAASNWIQSAYEVDARDDGGNVMWETGRVESDESVLVPWGGPPLHARERQHVRVRVWDRGGAESPWSESVVVEAGLLAAGDWSARFITPDWDEDTSRYQPGPMGRRSFALRAGRARARLYVTALGVYECEINGERVGDHVLAPGWSSYEHRLRYQTFDVTSMLHAGANAIGATVGDGWYRGRLGFPGVGGRNLYGDRLALIAQLEVTYADGTTETIVSDETWRAATGPLVASSIYDGETYDARLEMSGWSSPGFDDSAWKGVRTVDRDLSTLVAPPGPPVRRQQAIAPIAITTSPGGRTIVDFGQNLTGWVRITAEGAAGTAITLRHAEVLLDGELCVEPLRSAKATDTYILSGRGREMWEPRFTFHGFRYVEIDGWPGAISAADITAVAVYSDMERTGWFACSDEMVNKLHENIVWGMRGNFLDVPTDCPQRDERLGWTGDLTVFSPTACFLYDAAGFLTSWLADLRADQSEDGVVPIIVPNLPPPPGEAGARSGVLRLATAVWGDAAIIVPSVTHQRFGDTGIIETQYESMRAWVDAVSGLAGPGRLWDRGFQFADWLDPAAPPEDPRKAITDTHLVATAYFFRVTSLLADAAGLLNRDEDAATYRSLAGEIRAAFMREYVTAGGRVVSDSQTAYALAIVFDLLDTDEQRAGAGRRLASLVQRNGYRVGTGFVGTAIVLDALCMSGEHDAAYRMLLERECPSWMYPITMGATTIWERWDSMKPDGSVNAGSMTSFNHYALGAIGDWLHRSVGGIAPLAPGYRRFEVGPLIGGGLTWAEARHLTPYGMASSKWTLADGRVAMEVVVPANSTARVVPPDGSDAIEVGSGTHAWSFAIA
jgi:alpha-L-rhamnosidase